MSGSIAFFSTGKECISPPPPPHHHHHQRHLRNKIVHETDSGGGGGGSNPRLHRVGVDQGTAGHIDKSRLPRPEDGRCLINVGRSHCVIQAEKINNPPVLRFLCN